MKKNNISIETQKEAMQIAKATQKPNQTKEQTKLISQGIEKGIALYKKQQKEKAREIDKLKKKELRKKNKPELPDSKVTIKSKKPKNKTLLPWLLLILSWIGFIIFQSLTQV